MNGCFATGNFIKVVKVYVELMESLLPFQLLREIGSTLVDIHGQHEHQELMDETKHLSLLDQFGSKRNNVQA